MTWYSHAGVFTTDLIVNKRDQRPFHQGHIDRLMTSLQERGFSNPLYVRPSANGRYELLADGVGTFVAAQQLGIEIIPVTIIHEE